MRIRTPKQMVTSEVKARKLGLAARSSTVRSPQVPAAKAKAHLLALINEVDQAGHEFVITKRGKPVAKLVPVASAGDIVGCMKGTFRITGDVIGPEPDIWDAMQ